MTTTRRKKRLVCHSIKHKLENYRLTSCSRFQMDGQASPSDAPEAGARRALANQSMFCLRPTNWIDAAADGHISHCGHRLIRRRSSSPGGRPVVGGPHANTQARRQVALHVPSPHHLGQSAALYYSPRSSAAVHCPLAPSTCDRDNSIETGARCVGDPRTLRERELDACDPQPASSKPPLLAS